MSFLSWTAVRLKHRFSTTFALVSLATVTLLSGCAATPELATVRQIPELMGAFKVDGLAVTAVAGDEVLVSSGFGVQANGDAFTSTSTCGLYSATKVLASLTYARLAQDGRIDLDAPLGEYLADAPDDWREIPFFRLLNHTSGITMVVNKPEFGDIASNPQAGNEDIYRMVRDAPLDYEPGQYSRYRQSGYAVGEVILENRLGTSFDALVEQYITVPAGMTSTAHPSTSDKTQPPLLLSAGGYETTADNMAQLFLSLNNGAVIDASDWKNLLLDEAYVVNDYSLGNITETRNGVLTLGHRGGGARANIRYAPDQKVGAMVCTDDTRNNELAISLANMLIREITSGEIPQSPLLVALAGYEAMTGAEVVAAYKAAAVQGSRYDMADSEALLNRIGYSFLSREQTRDAIDVFSLNAELFPASPNTHDSLGEALLASGKPAAALLRYRKALTLDPDSANARAMVEKIEAQNP
ncbi:MAG: serine hydrolase [Pseudomonadota bacterium]